VGAFERPVRAGKNNDEGYVSASAQALVEHAEIIYEDWLGKPDVSLIIGNLLSGLGERKSLSELLETLASEVSKRVGGGAQ
jgi:hypothetical protein